MKRILLRVAAWGLLLIAGALLFPWGRVRGSAAASADGLRYGTDGSYVVPQNYREWVYLSSGIGMVYGPKGAALASQTGQMGQMEHSVFDNVFVDPDAYHYFLAKGTWPDKTVMILEIRGAETNVSINHGGHSQGGMMGMEVHLKDTSRFGAEKWAFFDVNPSGVGKLIPQTADCYTCHREHAAVDTTFAQFYPTLLPIAKSKGTLSPAFVKESEAEEKK